MKSYGQLELDRVARRWRITQLAPHVAIAFKRMFPRVPVTSIEIGISDTDEVRADLHWFMSRYPLDHDEWDELDAAVDRLAYRAAERERILLPTWRPGELQGFKEGKAAYLYQTQAAKIAVANGGMLLGDDVGLGKTISAIAALLFGAPMPAAIVVQPHLAGQWKKRIEEFSSLRVHIIKGRTPYDLPEADVYIFKYSNAAGWVDIIKEGPFRSVIYDEIQELRHGRGTAKGEAATVLSNRADFRMGLTATPVYNYGDEMHAVMEFVKPDLLGDWSEFIREWCSSGRIVGNPDGLGSYLRDTGYFLRRTEDDPTVDASMPPPNILEWEIDHDLAAVEGEQEIARQLAQTVLRGSFAEAGRAARELDMKMRQLTGIAKARAVAAYVSLLLKDSPRVLLAGWHREVYDIWREALAPFNPVLYTGSESAAGKQRSVDAFCGGDSRVMMMSLRSGAGLDGLQYHCNDAVVGELDWSPQVHYQFFGRLRRPGQEKQVNAHYLHTNWGSDPVLLEMLGIKADQSRGINDPGIAPKPRMTDESRLKLLAQHVLSSA
ncbi:DEAD/DEAH box helicase [Sphingobium yanoikuyae]|uniref:DEAD/DEAH box helicase n=1 Tax=Sphingobium yanoikuyae TaxID=13690 RepID=A0A3G2UMN0_SPHYA|nr:DEAD/DEAH box helicase [Sphingobium yanoikuyae]AYO76417.1 DEAD/DEAH box helicase [Sphingobium yanoikuyae]